MLVDSIGTVPKVYVNDSSTKNVTLIPVLGSFRLTSVLPGAQIAMNTQAKMHFLSSDNEVVYRKRDGEEQLLHRRRRLQKERQRDDDDDNDDNDSKLRDQEQDRSDVRKSCRFTTILGSNVVDTCFNDGYIMKLFIIKL